MPKKKLYKQDLAKALASCLRLAKKLHKTGIGLPYLSVVIHLQATLCRIEELAKLSTVEDGSREAFLGMASSAQIHLESLLRKALRVEMLRRDLSTDSLPELIGSSTDPQQDNSSKNAEDSDLCLLGTS